VFPVSRDDVTVALVHGCTQGPSGWDRVRQLLSQSDVPSVAVDLDPRDLDGATAHECAAHIAQVLENHARVILVGTSCAGLTIPVVTMLRPVEHLVFVCAGLPDIGRSATDQIFNDGLLHDAWLHYPGEPDSPDAAVRFMFNDCDGGTLAWSLTTVRLFMPKPAYDEVTPLESWPDTPSTYLLGTKDRIINQKWARTAVHARLGGPPLELDTGHCPQNSRPELVADILTGIANQTAAIRP
jgi:pimeloyl-ACP methyl ester carboxylesterase